MMEQTYFTCPITLKIFREPVMASDGHFYEKIMIKEWLIYSNKSPLNGNVLLNKDLITSRTFNTFLEKFLELNPDLISERFSEIIPHEYKKIYSNENYKKHRFDDKIYIHLINFEYVLENINNYDFMRMFIDNIDNLYYYIDKKERNVINYIITHSNDLIIKYLLDKNIDFEYQENDDAKWKPLNYLCKFSSIDSVKYGIDKGMNLDALYVNNNYNSISKINFDFIMCLFLDLEKKIHYEYECCVCDDEDDYDLSCLDAILRVCTFDTINRFIEKIKSSNEINDFVSFCDKNNKIFYSLCYNNQLKTNEFLSIYDEFEKMNIKLDLNYKCEKNYTPILLTIKNKNFDISKFILKHKDFDSKTLKVNNYNKFLDEINNELIKFLVSVIFD